DRPHISRLSQRRRRLALLSFIEGPITSDVCVAVMRAGLKHLMAHVPTERTANYHVRSEMLMACNPGAADRSRQPVCQELRKRPRILVSNHAGNCKTTRRVHRRKRITTHKESSSSASCKRPLPSGGIFEDFSLDNRADCCLPAENSGLSFLIVMLHVTQQEQSSPGSGQAGDPDIGKRHCVRNGAAGSGHVLLDGSVSLYEEASHKNGWDRPVPLLLLHPEGSREEFLLVQQKIFRK